MTSDERARELYEATCAELLYTTKAAWTRWDDLAAETRAGWIRKAERQAA